MYSARKVNGKKLYELAREGKTVERQARGVRIHQIEIEEISLPRVTMRVACSKGTYIRTLCHDIGEKLGCGGCMESLLRTRAGVFGLEESVRLSRLEELVREGKTEAAVIPVDEMFAEYRPCQTSERADRLLHNGNALEIRHFDGNGGQDAGEKIRVYDSKGNFCGIYMYHADRKKYQPVKMFLEG